MRRSPSRAADASRRRAGLACLALLSLAFLPRQASVGPQPDGTILVPTNQRIRPAGETLAFPGRPVDLAVSPAGRWIWVKDNRGVVLVERRDWRVRQELPLPEGGGSMHGIVVRRDGTRGYISTAQDRIQEALLGADGRLTWGRTLAAPGPRGEGNSHACGLALTATEDRLVACLSRNNTLAEYDLATGRRLREIPVGVAPYDVVLLPDGVTACVSNWGGRLPRTGDRTADSAGTPTVVDERGVGSTGSLSWVDLRTGRELAQTEVGLHPSDLALHPDGQTLFVANANSDTVSVVDSGTRTVRQTLLIRPDQQLPFGSAPNGLAVTPDGQTLFIAAGGNNAVAVAALEQGRQGIRGRIRGFIPAGWYPGAVAADHEQLYVANVKGEGSRHSRPGDPARSVYGYLGTVSRVPFPDRRTLARCTEQVRADAGVPAVLRAWERGRAGGTRTPVPARLGEPSVFEHVVYVIKENRTYDQVFGDLPQGNGDPGLCIFGKTITPNHHALAEEFVLLDNYYCNGVLSADGHSWSTEGNVTDHLEKAFGGFTRSYTFGDDPLTYSSSGFLWDRVLDAGLSFRNYGEFDYAEPVPRSATFLEIFRDWQRQTNRIAFSQQIGVERLRHYSCRDYPGWNMKIPDVLRADRFLKELAEFERNGRLPHLTLLYLPSDHTSGTTPGAPTPRAQMADNDLALGRVVEALSRSRFWPRTVLFVIEDDPQNGFDHVDGHRSLCLVISPYSRRRGVVSSFYNQAGILHTITRILGVPPLNQMDALAPTMEACFTARPALDPYLCRPVTVPLDELNPPLAVLSGAARHWALASLREGFARVDEAEEDTLNRILWHTMKGMATPYPRPAH